MNSDQKLILFTSDAVVSRLETLVATGLFGWCVGAAAEELLRIKLREIEVSTIPDLGEVR